MQFENKVYLWKNTKTGAETVSFNSVITQEQVNEGWVIYRTRIDTPMSSILRIYYDGDVVKDANGRYLWIISTPHRTCTNKAFAFASRVMDSGVGKKSMNNYLFVEIPVPKDSTLEQVFDIYHPGIHLLTAPIHQLEVRDFLEIVTAGAIYENVMPKVDID